MDVERQRTPQRTPDLQTVHTTYNEITGRVRFMYDTTKNGPFMSEDFREWLRSKVAVQRKTGCWEFTGAKDHAGFGRVFIEAGKSKLRASSIRRL